VPVLQNQFQCFTLNQTAHTDSTDMPIVLSGFPNLDGVGLNPFGGLGIIAQHPDQALRKESIHTYRALVGFTIEKGDPHAEDEQSIADFFG
jgi:hypothetical protein